MLRKILKFCFIIFCGLIGFVFAGCKNDAIRFYRESAVENTMKTFHSINAPKKDEVTRSGGLVIIRDNTSSRGNSEMNNLKFGPENMDFDLPVKFK